MRYIVLALGLCFVSGFLSAPLEAAVKSRSVKSHAVKARNSKVKPRKAVKPAKIRPRAN
jgi:hypothetical protein